MKLVKDDKLELAEAINKVTEDALKEQQKAQEEQAGAGMAQAMTPDMAAAGAAVQGMAGPQSPIASPQQSMPGMGSLGDLLGTLRRPAQTIQPMRGVNRGAV
jgi:hypothetical protein